uniref:Pyridine nucleotide-disulfide oxidoreductase domain-containing protein 2 n=1 Tax=Nocardioides sp. (strain JS1661) TaxID=1517491 RepID=A0A096ZEC5_NOCS1|nr:phytoene dehydrogenase [Nocardioides sp. JS1661]
MTTVDAVVIGAGHQGLSAALYLARAGWEVTVLEQSDCVGGATRSGEITEPGLSHDLYATNLNLFCNSPVFAEFEVDLARHGFTLARTDKPYANVFSNARSLRIYSDAELTSTMLGQHNADDLDGWRQLRGLYDEFMENLMPVYGQPMPSLASARTALRALRRLGPRRFQTLAQLLASSTRELGNRWFESDEVKTLLACWGMHLDLAPDVSFGAMFPFIETFADMDAGISIARGGMSALPTALAGLVEENGGQVRTASRVAGVSSNGDRATGVVLADGTVIRARRAVIANTTPTQLFQEMLPSEDARIESDRRRAQQFQYGPGSMMIHLSLDGPVTWAAHEDLRDFAYVHVAQSVDDLARTYQQSRAGLLPDRPLLVVGQTSRVDPSRTPDQREILWIQVRTVPSRITADSVSQIPGNSWAVAKEPMADRVLDQLESYAPGLHSLVRARSVLSPDDLAAHNPNLVGGDALAGSHHVSQNFMFRPWVGASRYQTSLAGLHMVGASTWPGAGVNAMSGYLLAHQLLRKRRRLSHRPRRAGSRTD